MITNRTQTDIDAALKIRREKVQTGADLTATDVAALERGFVTVNTLNRIEEMQATLQMLFNDAGYWNTAIVTKSWDETQIFDGVELQRIVENAKILRNAFFAYPATPQIPAARYHFENFNALEKNLADMEEMVADMVSRYRQCGDFECGEE